MAAAGACAVVLAVGMLWPTEPEAAAPAGTASRPAPAATSHAEGTTPGRSDAGDRSEGAPVAVSDAEDDLAAAGAAVLTARTACADETSCLRGLVEDPDRAFPAGVLDLPADQRKIVLLDSFGGAAVLRVDALTGESASQLIVLVARDGKWLLRDVHDVAEQP